MIQELNTSSLNVTLAKLGTLETIFSCSLTFLLFVMFVISIAGNTIVIGTMLNTWYNTISKTSNMLVFVLAILDLVNATVIIPLAFVTSLGGEWLFGDTSCYIQGILYIFLTSGANNILAMISVNRLLLIQKPNSIHTRVVKQRTRTMFGCCAGSATFVLLCFALPSGGTVGFRPGVDVICMPIWGGSWPSLLVMSVVWCFTFYLPLAVMTVSYVKMCRIIKSRVKKITPGIVYGGTKYVLAPKPKAEFTSMAGMAPRGDTGGNSSSNKMTTPSTTDKHEDVEKKTVVTLLIVIGIFAVCFTPQMAVKFHRALHGGVVPSALQTTAVALSLLNSMLNPLVYSLRSMSFRMAAADFLLKLKDCI